VPLDEDYNDQKRQREQYSMSFHEKGGERNKKPCQLGNHENVELGKTMATTVDIKHYLDRITERSIK